MRMDWELSIDNGEDTYAKCVHEYMAKIEYDDATVYDKWASYFDNY